MEDITQSSSSSKTKGALEGAKEKVSDILSRDEDQGEEDSGEEQEEQEERPASRRRKSQGTRRQEQ
jgi:hypothetical protein